VKRILVALDGSPREPLVLATAAKLARLTQARLVLFRAVGLPPELAPDLLEVSPLRVEGALRVAARASLDRLATTVEPGLVESAIVEIGTAWDSIVRAAKQHEADLIVIGSHGYGGIDRVIGTTAAKVVNHADRNVFIVRNALT
jgi:nucleotide-binding universal stress UspA family protein